MLTIFACPKHFTDPHIAVIQRNAITSWTLIHPPCEIILFGDDEGTAEVAREFGVRHVPEVARNEFGTPLVNDLFERAQRLALHDHLCYVNADIILMSDFPEAVQRVASQMYRFLMVGKRRNIELREPIGFATKWEERLRSYACEYGQLDSWGAIDYFVFSREIWGKIPPFAIGRNAWDNWLIYGARAQRVPVIDATNTVMAIHQNHDYSHVPVEAGSAIKGPEARRNLELIGGQVRAFTMRDATHLLIRGRVERALGLEHLSRYLATTSILHPRLALLGWIMNQVMTLSRPVRLALGITLSAGELKEDAK